MHLKRFFAILLALILTLSLSACSTSPDPTIDSSDDTSSVVSDVEEEKPEEPQKYLNTLTGELSLTDSTATSKKPVAITINNVRTAQSVQTGLTQADVVFETEVEGGITRLLALFADPTVVGKIGTVRSLRVPFAEIARGMGAVLFFHGIDEDYCRPVLKSLDISYLEIDAKVYGQREKNGKAYEHTLYTSGEKLDKAIKNKKMKYDGSSKTWLNFSETAEKVAPTGNVANTITAPFSSSYQTQFLYDSETGKYIRARKGTPFTDYVSGEKEYFSNVFILETNISDYPDHYHRKVDLSSGNGYYASAGGYTAIKWTKGDAEDSFKFTLADGSALTVNQGNSYVCIIDKSRDPKFE